MKYFNPRIKIKLGRFRFIVYTQMFIGLRMSNKQIAQNMKDRFDELPLDKQTPFLEFLNK